MKYLLIVLLLTGCDEIYPKYRGNDYVIAEKDKCIHAGMDYFIGDYQQVFCVHPK